MLADRDMGLKGGIKPFVQYFTSTPHQCLKLESARTARKKLAITNLLLMKAYHDNV